MFDGITAAPQQVGICAACHQEIHEGEAMAEGVSGRKFHRYCWKEERVQIALHELLDELLAMGSEECQLSDWEIEFIDSLDKARRANGDEWRFTEKQAHKLREIAEKGG
jgi:hypothetical protein